MISLNDNAWYDNSNFACQSWSGSNNGSMLIVIFNDLLFNHFIFAKYIVIYIVIQVKALLMVEHHVKKKQTSSRITS